MSKGLIRSIMRATPLEQKIIKQTIVIEDLTISVDGAAGVGFGSVAAVGLPEGNILILGSVANLTFAGSGSDANLVDTWNGDFGVGTTPVDDGTLGGDDIDLIPTTSVGPAVAEVSPVTRGVSTDAIGGDVLNNTAGGDEVNINLLIDDADISGTVEMTVTGAIYLAYVMLGDD